MRISSAQIFNIANNSMADASQALISTQEQLSTGQRVLNPSDDPVASTKIMSLQAEISTISQYQNNINIGKNNLVIEESVLQGVNNLIQRIQELAVQAGNTATLSPSEYQSLADEVDGRLSELQNLLNTQNANGDYIFGGYKSTEPPFIGSRSSGYKYIGDDGQQHVKVANATTVAMSDSGKNIFVDVQSERNTITTSLDPNNRQSSAITVSIGSIVDQEVYDAFYPEDIVISFNADSNVIPAGKNFTAYEKSTGRAISGYENVPYSNGGEIIIQGASVRITGNPESGDAAVPAIRDFGVDLPAAGGLATTETFEIEIGGRVETFTLPPVGGTAGVVTALNDTVTLYNGRTNADRLASIGISVTATGFSAASGVNFTIRNASDANVDSVLGINAVVGSTSNDGVVAESGDKVYIDSTDKQDILTTFARFSEVMRNYDGSSENEDILSEIVATSIANLSHAQTSILEVTSKIGARFNTLDSTEQLHLDAEIVSQELLSQLRDVDYAEASTRLASQSLILEAAQSSFVRVSRLTLFSQL